MKVKLIILLTILACALGGRLNRKSTLHRERRAIGFSDKNRLWPDKTVYYKFDTNHAALLRGFKRVFKELEAKTCVKFKESKSSSPKDYLLITSNNGKPCAGSNGYGIKKHINIPRFCFFMGIIRRMVMHSLGFFNMVQAPDRDDYVTINEYNIPFESDTNFEKLPRSYINYYGEKYDFASVLHYPYKAFAIDRDRPTIVAKDLSKMKYIKENSNFEFSFYDLYSISKAYQCNTRCWRRCSCRSRRPYDCESYFDNKCNCVTPTDAVFTKWPPVRRFPNRDLSEKLQEIYVGSYPIKDVTSDYTEQKGANIYEVLREDLVLLVVRGDKIPTDIFMDDRYLDPTGYKNKKFLHFLVDKHLRDWILFYDADWRPYNVIPN